jgi:two-component system phosphate regulon sensor histidine kinase PhoR
LRWGPRQRWAASWSACGWDGARSSWARSQAVIDEASAVGSASFTPGATVEQLGEQLGPADELGIGLVRVNSERIVQSANRSAAGLLGWRPRGLVGKSLLETFLDHGVEELADVARRDGHASGEYVLSGEPPRTIALHVWQADDGGAWYALTDVSELARLRRIRSEFVGNLSHELRTPLSTVRLLTESLMLEAERTELPSRVKENIAKIDVETGHLVQMVNELLDLAKIEQGDAPMRHDDVDMTRVVNECVARLHVYAERQTVALRVDVATGTAPVVVGDEDRLGQLLANLVHNAIKFSAPGSEVVVHVREDGENVVVEVEDHGPGIPAADRNRIFERFYKVDRARSRGRGGTGLGLAISRHIVDRHRGHIWVQSDEGSGSSFFVSLPRADLAMNDTASQNESQPTPASVG